MIGFVLTLLAILAILGGVHLWEWLSSDDVEAVDF